MTQTSLRLLALSASLTAGTLSAAESVSVPAAPTPKQQKVVQVSNLNSAEEYLQFQNNVQVMQNEKQAYIEANAIYEKEKDPAKKKEMKAKLDQMLAKLSDDNQKMFKVYGFSLERNYTVVIDKARVFMLVSDEEFAKIEKDQAAAAKAEKDAAAKKK
jgi:hypothetical protein